MADDDDNFMKMLDQTTIEERVQVFLDRFEIKMLCSLLPFNTAKDREIFLAIVKAAFGSGMAAGESRVAAAMLAKMHEQRTPKKGPAAAGPG